VLESITGVTVESKVVADLTTNTDILAALP
jgi:hypothetical protein